MGKISVIYNLEGYICQKVLPEINYGMDFRFSRNNGNNKGTLIWDEL